MTDETLTLEPCPFCGGEASIVEGEECAYVQCQTVKMHRAMFFDGDNNAANEVRDEWNRRAHIEEVGELVGRLRDFAASTAEFKNCTEQDGKDILMARQAADALTALQAELTALKADNERLTAALQFYADSWEDDFEFLGTEPRDCIPTDALYEDKGETARAALGKDK